MSNPNFDAGRRFMQMAEDSRRLAERRRRSGYRPSPARKVLNGIFTLIFFVVFLAVAAVLALAVMQTR
ncbi:hypothetical protein [Dactylosporangium sp. CA-139066]|uniref:hypothetical protein n=1 Tax=Dactylosporangium sp. CA-139066 TaxID=3239930 RepID=UPI003D93A3CC